MPFRLPGCGPDPSVHRARAARTAKGQHLQQPLAPRDRDEDGLSLGSLGRIVARLAPLEQAFQKMFTHQRSFSSQRSSM